MRVWLILLVCCYCSGCVSMVHDEGKLSLFEIGDSIQRGANLRRLARQYGPPDLIDFKANRVGYRASYEITERDILFGWLGESKETFLETWYLILDIEVPKDGLMPVELYWQRDKTDLPTQEAHTIPSHTFTSYQGLRMGARKATWSKWKERKGYYHQNK